MRAPEVPTISLDTKESSNRQLEVNQEEELQLRTFKKFSTFSLAKKVKRGRKVERRRRNLAFSLASEVKISEEVSETLEMTLEVMTLKETKNKLMKKSKSYQTTTCLRIQTLLTLT
jgi:hypothetical protein